LLSISPTHFQNKSSSTEFGQIGKIYHLSWQCYTRHTQKRRTYNSIYSGFKLNFFFLISTDNLWGMYIVLNFQVNWLSEHFFIDSNFKKNDIIWNFLISMNSFKKWQIILNIFMYLSLFFRFTPKNKIDFFRKLRFFFNCYWLVFPDTFKKFWKVFTFDLPQSTD